MYEHSWFIQRIKNYLSDGWSRDNAITQAVQDCLDNGIMTEFMKEHGSEAVNMLYTQWNWDDAMEVEREEAYEEGKIAGMAEGKIAGMAEGRIAGMAEGKIAGIAEGKNLGERQAVLDLLEDLGEIPEDIRTRIHTEEDQKNLRQWLKAAARAASFEAFREKMG